MSFFMSGRRTKEVPSNNDGVRDAPPLRWAAGASGFARTQYEVRAARTARSAIEADALRAKRTRESDDELY